MNAMKLIDVIGQFLLLIIVISAITINGQAQELTKVDAFEISEQIENGDDIYLNNVYIVGEFNLSKKHLKTIPIERKSKGLIFSYDNFNLKDEQKIVESNIIIINSIFKNNVDFSNVQFRKRVDFSNTQFLNRADFTGTNFDDVTSFWDSNFSGITSFWGVNFNADTYFKNTSFSSLANFGRQILMLMSPSGMQILKMMLSSVMQVSMERLILEK